MVTRKRKVLRTEADIVASIDEELANNSDSDTDCVPEISSSEESDGNDISDSGPSVNGFCKKGSSTKYSTLHRKSSSTICCSKWNRYVGICLKLHHSRTHSNCCQPDKFIRTATDRDSATTRY
jgi:hypothetical protein